MIKNRSLGQKIICLNRKASFNYFFKELIEAGICLKGSEVKSLRDGKANISEFFFLDKMEKYSYSILISLYINNHHTTTMIRKEIGNYY